MYLIVITSYTTEWRIGELRVTDPPHDAISRSGTMVQFNCSVEGLSYRESVTWWHTNPHTGTQKLFVSNPTTVDKQLPYYLDSKKYEIRGHYNLVVRDIGISDSGVYTCDITGHSNYSATLTVVGGYFFYVLNIAFKIAALELAPSSVFFNA